MSALTRLQHDFDRLLGRWPWHDEEPPSVSPADWVPAVDVKEEENRFVIRADVPGIATKDIDVTLNNGTLTISGKRESESKDEKEAYKRVERCYGSFMRRFTLPNTADGDEVTARCSDGVLEVIVPKDEKAQPRRITVKGN
jgi:HSP20 family protein